MRDWLIAALCVTGLALPPALALAQPPRGVQEPLEEDPSLRERSVFGGGEAYELAKEEESEGGHRDPFLARNRRGNRPRHSEQLAGRSS